jgi:hypothetical protein
MTTQPHHQITAVKTSPNQARMKVTAPRLIHWSGLAAMVAGLIFAGIQPIHPPDILASVTTGGWAIIVSLKFAMCLLFLIGIAGLYARQIEESGWLGFVGFLLLIVSWFLQTGFVFVGLFILPLMATAAPEFVVSYLGIVNGSPGEMSLGALVPAYAVIGVTYLLGGLVFGIATLRAGILPRWPAGLLALAAMVTPAAALLPHEIQRLAAVPMGISLLSLGFALWSERREKAPERALSTEIRQVREMAARESSL